MKITRTVIEVEIYGEAVKLKRPNYKETQDYRENLKKLAEHEDAGPVMKSFLVKMGLPEGLFEELEMTHISDILDLISGSKKK